MAAKKAGKKDGKGASAKKAAAKTSKRPAPPKPQIAPPPRRPHDPRKPQPRPEPKAKPKEFVADPSFVRQATAAERKAALEAVLDREGVAEALPAVTAPKVEAPPAFVLESSPAARKAAVEQLAEESGVKGLLAKAPWKRSGEPQAVAAPPTPAAPAPKDQARAHMTKAPLEQTIGRNPPSLVVLDTNALMMQFQFHIDIEKEVNRMLSGNYRMVVPQLVVDELQRLAKEGAQKEQGEARMALELARTFDIVESPGDGDTGILRLAEKLNAVVVTNDKVLRARLRAKDIPNIYMRSRAFLTIEGHIPGQ